MSDHTSNFKERTLTLSMSAGVPLIKNPVSNLTEALLNAAKGSYGIRYLRKSEEDKRIGYGELLEESERVLGGIRKRGGKAGEGVIFQLPDNEDFIIGLWGCLLGGMIATPLAVAPRYDEENAALGKLLQACKLLEGAPILTCPALVGPIKAWAQRSGLKGLQVWDIEELKAQQGKEHYHEAQGSDPALLLLTSGSTGQPKGVVLTHDNILSRSAATKQADGLTAEDITLNWMPLDHVGGVVMFHLRDVLVGCEQIHALTEQVLPDPLQWLSWMERYRATVTWAPNFAYGLIVDAVLEAQGEGKRGQWDLSSMRFILNGGEAIVSRTARRFLKVLEPYGLDPRAMRPAWGMSETSSGITSSFCFNLEQTSDEDSFVEVGGPFPGVSLRVVDEQDQLVAETKTGRLQVHGPMIMKGYYRAPELNQEIFTKDGWFKTGDLAFLKEGRLTITGREKDVIIINGINFYSHEIETIVERIEGVELSYTAACAIRHAGENTDRLAIFFHTNQEGEKRDALVSRIRTEVHNQNGVAPDYVIVVKKEEVPKTGIGKIQRAQLRERFVAGVWDQQLKPKVEEAKQDWAFTVEWREQPLGASKRLSSEAVIVIGDKLKAEPVCQHLLGAGIKAEWRPLEQLSSAKAKVIILLAESTPQAMPQDPHGLQEMVLHRIKPLFQVIQAIKDQEGLQFYWVSAGSQAIDENEGVDLTAAPLRGLLKTIPEELGISASWIDLDPQQQDYQPLVEELFAWTGKSNPDREISYRQNKRWVAGLKAVELKKPSDRLMIEGGLYLLSGGLGGIGRKVAHHLLNQYHAKLIILGQENEDQFSAEKAAAWKALQQQGQVVYTSVDLTDVEKLESIVAQTQERWQSKLAGVLHLAGTYHERPLIEESIESLRALFAPKVAGAWALHQLVEKTKGAKFIGFSSLISAFGGYHTGAYAAANNFLDSLTLYQRRQGIKGSSLLWSTWQETGMSRGVQAGAALRARGYREMTVERGLCDLETVLTTESTTPLLLGVDSSKATVKSYLPTGSPDPSKPPAASYVPPTTATEKKMVQIWQRLLKRDQIGIYDNFFEIGGKSLLAARLFAQIDKEFGQSLPLATLFSFSTIQQLALLLDEKKRPSANIKENPCKITPIQTKGSLSPLFFIPGAGSDAVAFRELALKLKSNHPFYGLQAPGLDAVPTELPFMTIEETATAFIQAIRKIQPHGPYYLGGHCFGCLLTYEIARQLWASEEKIAQLILLDPIVNSTLSDNVVDQDRLSYHWKKFWKMALLEKMTYGWSRIKNFRRTLIVRRRLAFSYQQAREMHLRYKLLDYPGHVTVFLANDSFYSLIPDRDPRLAWSKMAKGGVEYHKVEGDHHSILHGQEAIGLARKLDEVLMKTNADNLTNRNSP